MTILSDTDYLFIGEFTVVKDKVGKIVLASRFIYAHVGSSSLAAILDTVRPDVVMVSAIRSRMRSALVSCANLRLLSFLRKEWVLFLSTESIEVWSTR